MGKQGTGFEHWQEHGKEICQHRKLGGLELVSKETTFKDVADRLDELIAWQRFESLPKLRTILLKELDSEAKKLAYEMTDGEKSRRDIATALGISDDSVQKWWEKWYELAIVGSSKEFKGRPRQIVSLQEIGIKIPKKASTKKEDGQAARVRDEQVSEPSPESVHDEKTQ